MRQQLFVSDKIFRILAFAGILLLFFACETDLEKINRITAEQDYPTLTGRDVETIYTDSAKITAKLLSDELYQYSMSKEPYYEFPSGLILYVYNDSGNVSSQITADYAKYFEEKRLWEARNNVVVKDLEKGDQLNTEEMFWDMNEEKIYSDVFTKITNDDGVFYGNGGFEANQDFSKWKLKGTQGTVNVKDEF